MTPEQRQVVHELMESYMHSRLNSIFEEEGGLTARRKEHQLKLVEADLAAKSAILRISPPALPWWVR